MKGKRYTEAQITYALRQAEGGTPVRSNSKRYGNRDDVNHGRTPDKPATEGGGTSVGQRDLAEMEIRMDLKKPLVLTFVAIAIVALALGLRTKQVDFEVPPVTEPLATGSQLTTQSQSVQAMQHEMAALRQSALRPADVAAENLPQSPEEEMKALAVQLNSAKASFDKALSNRRQQEFEKLMAAGFAPDRIEWIRHRSDELQAQWRKDQIERRRQGLPLDPAQEAVHYYDQDAGLRSEIGDDEYTRYRLALGRPAGIAVAAVTQGSPVGRAGLLPGDDIVNYGGTRVFNLAELNALASRRDPVDSVLVDVQRNGQTIQLVVPGGPLLIETKVPLPLSGLPPPTSPRLQ